MANRHSDDYFTFHSCVWLTDIVIFYSLTVCIADGRSDDCITFHLCVWLTHFVIFHSLLM